jgi:hypothetical protein
MNLTIPFFPAPVPVTTWLPTSTGSFLDMKSVQSTEQSKSVSVLWCGEPATQHSRLRKTDGSRKTLIILRALANLPTSLTSLQSLRIGIPEIELQEEDMIRNQEMK